MGSGASSGTPAGAISGASLGTGSSGVLGPTSGTISSGAVVSSGTLASSGTVASSGTATSGTVAITPMSDAGPDRGNPPVLTVPSPGCGNALTIPKGQWVSQPTGCGPGMNNQGTAACQAIPPGSTVPVRAAMGSPEYRGWWVQVPTGYDPNKPYTVIYNAIACGDGNYFHAGQDGYPYSSVDNGQAILVGLDFDTFSVVPGCPDARDPQSNDLTFMPWLMNEIESTFCVDTSREWISEYANDASLAQQLDCALPDKFRGQVLVTGFEPGAPGYPSALPTCNPAPMAAFYVHDQGDTDATYGSILPGCSRVLKQNGCSNTTCNPLDKTLTTPYPVPAGVTPPAGTVCVQFNGCPAAYPVVFCVTQNQDHSDDQNWGVVTLFWDFINGVSPALPLCPAGQAYQNGECAPCPGGETACSSACVNEQNDPTNCGACGAVCPIGGTCLGGTCACPIGDTICSGACVDEQTDQNDCGACGMTCGLLPDAAPPPAGVPICNAGVCTCPGGQAACAGLCVDEQTDPSFCGACDNACPGSAPVCLDGVCSASCPDGGTPCGNACVNELTDPVNCGGCGIACESGGTCQVGLCDCPSGDVVCGRVCVNEQTNTANCGSCGVVCPVGAACQNGVCACPSGDSVCAGLCVDEQTDPNFCGACNNSCPGSAPFCRSGVCAPN
jgi:hypothetical protein